MTIINSFLQLNYPISLKELLQKTLLLKLFFQKERQTFK